MISLVLVIASIYLTAVLLESTYKRKLDKFGNNFFLPDALGALWVLIPALLLALVRSLLDVSASLAVRAFVVLCCVALFRRCVVAAAVPPQAQQQFLDRCLLDAVCLC